MAISNFYKFGIELTLTEENYNFLIDHCIDTCMTIDELLFLFIDKGIEDLKLFSL